MQHLVIKAVREQWARLFPRERFTGAGLAKLGRHGGPRRIEKRIAGYQPIQLTDLVQWVALLGDAVLQAVPTDARQLFPEPYQPFLTDWAPGNGVLPTFSAPAGREVDWPYTTAELAKYLEEEAASERARLLRADVVTYAMISKLGINPNLVEHTDQVNPRSELRSVLVNTAEPVRISLAYLPDDRTNPQEAAVGIVTALHSPEHRVELATARHVVVLVLGRIALAQMNEYNPWLVTAGRNENVTLPFQHALRAGLPSGEPADVHDLDLSVLGRASTDPAITILAVHVEKRR